MLLNYNTVDSCFISSDWQVTSRGMFAGSCIGVLLLCIAIEAVRRLGREYDRRLIWQARVRLLRVERED
jgi:copper transporter 1